MREKVVLAYSGGLDTSIIIPWLKENYNCDVIAMIADVGQGEDIDAVVEKAHKTGAAKVIVKDLREEFLRDYVFPALRAGAEYEHKYLLGTSLARPVIAKHQVEVALQENATALAHGCTGKGNDQVRFEHAFQALAPELKVIAPWREWTLKSREDCLDYAEARGIAVTASREKIHSRRMDTFLQHLIDDGGNWNYVRALIGKYGAVPESVMPDDYAASHTGEMVALMSASLRKAVLEVRQPRFDGAEESGLREWKMGALTDIYKILVLCLGQPPENFEWRYENKDGKVTPLEKYTPQSFRRKFLDADLNRYVSLVNYPGQPMHAHLEWAWERNMADQSNLEAVNISMDEMVEMTVKSILADPACLVWGQLRRGRRQKQGALAAGHRRQA